MVGKSTSGNWLMPMRDAATRPKRTVAAMSIQAKTGFWMQTSVMLHRRRLLRDGLRPAPLSALRTRLGTAGDAGGRGGGSTDARAPWRRRAAPRRRAPPGARRRRGPRRTSTPPSAVRRPSSSTRSRATSPSTTKARKPRSLGRMAVCGMTGAAAAPPTGTSTSANAPGRSSPRAGSSTSRGHRHHPVARVGGARRPGGCAPSSSARGPSRTVKRASMPGASGVASCSRHPEAQQQRIAAHQRGEHGAGLDVLAGLDGAGLDDPGHRGAHEGVAQVELGQREGGARLRRSRRRPTATRVRQASTSSARTRSGFLALTAWRRSRPSAASSAAASALSSAARADSHREAVALGLDLGEHASRRPTVSPSRKRTRSTTPATRAVTATCSKASTEPTARTAVLDACAPRRVATSTGKRTSARALGAAGAGGFLAAAGEPASERAAASAGDGAAAVGSERLIGGRRRLVRAAKGSAVAGRRGGVPAASRRARAAGRAAATCARRNPAARPRPRPRSGDLASACSSAVARPFAKRSRTSSAFWAATRLHLGPGRARPRRSRGRRAPARPRARPRAGAGRARARPRAPRRRAAAASGDAVAAVEELPGEVRRRRSSPPRCPRGPASLVQR